MNFLIYCLKCDARMIRLTDNDKIYWECCKCQHKIRIEVII